MLPQLNVPKFVDSPWALLSNGSETGGTQRWQEDVWKGELWLKYKMKFKNMNKNLKKESSVILES